MVTGTLSFCTATKFKEVLMGVAVAKSFPVVFDVLQLLNTIPANTAVKKCLFIKNRFN